MQAAEQLFVITASNPDAKRHVEKSIANPIDPALCAKYFDSATLNEVVTNSVDGKFYAWGARPGERNEPNWNAMRPGAHVLLYQEGRYTYWTRVISKQRSALFAEAVWGRDAEGQTWEFMYFLQPSTPIQCPAKGTADFLPGQYQGFSLIKNERVQRIVSQYGSVEKFVQARMKGTETYLMFRSNEGSEWSDKEGHSYHYGNTVANYTAVVTGARFLLSPSFSGSARIIGTGKIGKVSDEPGAGKATRTFRAAYEGYRPLRPPRVLTAEDNSLLASLEDINIQHSSHRITKEVFERLGQPARAWIFQSKPTLYDMKGALKLLKTETFRVSRYKDEIGLGDRVYLWESGKNAGIIGVAEIIEGLKVRVDAPESVRFRLAPQEYEGDGSSVVLRLLRNVDPTVSHEQIHALPTLSNLSILRQPQGINFRVTPPEAEAIEQLLSERKGLTEMELRENRILPKNLILYGPPGTGKTYESVGRAIEVLDPEYFVQNRDNRQELKKRFDEHVRSRRVEFVTFHQSFAYEDFVEGIRAETTEEGRLRYDVKDGVFKDLCNRARRASEQGRELGINESPRIWKISIDGTGPSATRDYCLSHGEARIGWGDVGDLRSLDETNEAFNKLGRNDQRTLKDFSEEIRPGDIFLCIKSVTEIQAVGVVQGDYEFNRDVPASVKSDYSNLRRTNWFLKGLSLSLESLNGGKGFTQKTVYELNRFTWNQLLEVLRLGNNVPLPLTQREERPNYVLIVDEINRGNISRIFGELITLIEVSKREGSEEALEVTLPYSKHRFSVPPNVYLIGTMNTADRSLTGLDIALRRRFRFQEVPPQPDLLKGVVVEGVDVRALLMILNERIEVMLDRDHCLGHSYFLPLRADNSLTRLALIFDQEIIPLLREYFFEDSERIRWVLNDHRKEPAYQFLLRPKSDLANLFGDEPGMPTETRRLQVNANAFSQIQSFSGIIQEP
jgi:5-methylcytosine-specific restriction protein B